MKTFFWAWCPIFPIWNDPIQFCKIPIWNLNAQFCPNVTCPLCAGERLIQFATEHLVTEVLIHPQVHFLKWILHSNQFYWLSIAGEHLAAMYEEHAGKFHQASPHPPRWIHLRRSRVLDTTGGDDQSQKIISWRKPLSRMGPFPSRTLPQHLKSMMSSEWCDHMKTPFQSMFTAARRENGNRWVNIQCWYKILNIKYTHK